VSRYHRNRRFFGVGKGIVHDLNEEMKKCMKLSDAVALLVVVARCFQKACGSGRVLSTQRSDVYISSMNCISVFNKAN